MGRSQAGRQARSAHNGALAIGNRGAAQQLHQFRRLRRRDRDDRINRRRVEGRRNLVAGRRDPTDDLRRVPDVRGIDDAKFQECVKDAEANCPISKLLGKGLEISSTATLVA